MIKRMSVSASIAILSIVYLTGGWAKIRPHSTQAQAQDLIPPLTQIELVPVMTDLDQPVFVTNAKDGSNRLFIVERAGRVKVLQPDEPAAALFLDITERVRTDGEGGLTGLAFHPNYKSNRRFFICYSRRADGATIIAEHRVSKSNPNVAETREQVLLEIPQPSDIHHGGMIEFGPDGLLYISTGDGNWEDPDGNAQNLEDLKGKLLRINIDRPNGEIPYSSPSSNPFFGNVSGRDEVYALGFRNPWRFSFDRATGELYLGDVGHEVREEINLIKPGGNYGWRVFEGTRCTGFDPDGCDSLKPIAPVVEYDHSDGRCSVTGGRTYRGGKSSLPDGAYLFADFCTGEIFMLHDGTQHFLLDSDFNITSFGEDEDGEIYVVAIGGTMHRITGNLGIQEPEVRIDSVEVRSRSSDEPLQPITTRPNGKRFDLVIRGSGFAPGSTIFAGGEKLKSATSVTPSEVIVRLRRGSLSVQGSLTIEVVNPDGTHSNIFEIEILSEDEQ